MFVTSYQKLREALPSEKDRPQDDVVDGFAHELENNHDWLALYGTHKTLLGMAAFRYLDHAPDRAPSKLYISALVVAEPYWDYMLGMRILQKLWLDHPSCWLHGLMRKYCTISKAFALELGALPWPQAEGWPHEYQSSDQYEGFKLAPVGGYQAPASLWYYNKQTLGSCSSAGEH
ncbi:hypothetical protein ABBQ38_006686 [Trebouxia sp. C0009 RCD-2024]